MSLYFVSNKNKKDSDEVLKSSVLTLERCNEKILFYY